MKDASIPGRKRTGNGEPQGIDWLRLSQNEENEYLAQWSEYDATDIVSVIGTVTRMGYGITFGTTSDGGALSLAILINGEQPRKFYFTSKGQFSNFVQRLLSEFV